MRGNGKATENFYLEECNNSYEWAEESPIGFHKSGLWIKRLDSESLKWEARTAGRHFLTTIPGFVSKIDIHELYLMDTKCIIWSGKLYKIVE